MDKQLLFFPANKWYVLSSPSGSIAQRLLSDLQKLKELLTQVPHMLLHTCKEHIYM